MKLKKSLSVVTKSIVAFGVALVILGCSQQQEEPYPSIGQPSFTGVYPGQPGLPGRDNVGNGRSLLSRFDAATLQSLCLGWSEWLAPQCSSIRDPDARAACRGVATNNLDRCEQISDRNLRMTCHGMVLRDDSRCDRVRDGGLRQICRAEVLGRRGTCRSISDIRVRNICIATIQQNSHRCSNIR